jgi:hypothetical protein
MKSLSLSLVAVVFGALSLTAQAGVNPGGGQPNSQSMSGAKVSAPKKESAEQQAAPADQQEPKDKKHD